MIIRETKGRLKYISSYKHVFFKNLFIYLWLSHPAKRLFWISARSLIKNEKYMSHNSFKSIKIEITCNAHI